MANLSTSNRYLEVIDLGFIDYQSAWDLQKEYFELRLNNKVPDTLFLLEHPNTYTLGKTADRSNLIGSEDFLKNNGFSIYDIDRGGDITYHGPGQIVGYPIINLNDYYPDAHKYLRMIEESLIETCGDYGLTSGRKKDFTGVWIDERKIAAIGVKISRWITMHGFAFNVNTDLSLFGGIIPCGIKDKAVTSLKYELGSDISIMETKEKITNNFAKSFEYGTYKVVDKNEILLNK